jgi:rsbT co-antagonist protein RsbR
MKLQLGAKANLLVISVLSVLLCVIVLLLQMGMTNATTRAGHSRITQEVEVVQRELAKIQQDALASASLLATSPDLIAAIQNKDAASSRTVVLIHAARFGFDHAVVSNATGERLVAADRTNPDELAREDVLITRALLSLPALGITTGNDQSQLALSVAVPLRNGDDNLLGALLVSRTIDTQFMDELNLSRPHIYLSLLHQGRTLATTATIEEQRLHREAQQLTLLTNQAAMARALTGQTVTSETLVTVQGIPYAQAYLPLTVQGTTTGTVGIMVDVGELAAIQSELTRNLAFVFSALALVAILIMTLFIRQVVTRPIRALQTAAQQIARGDYAQTVTIKTQDEIGQLASAMNTTAQAIQAREASLQATKATLEQQAVELEHKVGELRQLMNERNQLSDAIRELSSPVMPILDGVLVMPLIGAIDTERAALLTTNLLTAIESHRAHMVILDVTGVPIIDTQVAHVLLQAAQATRLLGARTVLAGLRPELAQTIVGLGLNMQGLETRPDLQSAIAYSLQRPQQAKRQLQTT